MTAEKRKLREEQRRTQIRAALERGGESADASVNEVAAIIETETRSGDVETDKFEEETDTDIESVAVSIDDIKSSRKSSVEPMEEIEIGGQKFVRLQDLLPPCPPRGMFDVERIRESVYFFS